MKTIILFAAAIFLFIAANFAARLFQTQTSLWKDADSYVWNTKMGALFRGDLKNTEILILGDSQTMSGVLPEILEKSLRRKVYNFGLPAQQPEGMESLAALLKEQAPSLRTIVINVNPYCMFKTEVYDAFLTYYRGEMLNHAPGTLLLRPDLAGRSPGQFLHQSLQSLPIYSLHFAVEQHFENPASNKKNDPEQAEAYFRTGWSPLESIRSAREKNLAVGRIISEHRGFWTWKNFTVPELRCSSSIVEDVPVRGVPYFDRPLAGPSWQRTLAKLSGSGYRIVIAQIPFSEVWNKSTDYDGVYRRLNARIGEFKKDHLNLVVIPLPPAADYRAPGMFQDWTHLSACGAARYTKFLAEAMKGL